MVFEITYICFYSPFINKLKKVSTAYFYGEPFLCHEMLLQ
jgi:hypothetical protein